MIRTAVWVFLLGYTYTYTSSYNIYTRVYVQLFEYLQLYEFYMNLNKIRSINGTEDLLLSITKSYETCNEQTHRKARETLEFKMVKPRETLLFNPPISIEGSWMIGLTDLEVYNSIFNITEDNKKFEHYKFPDETGGGVSYTKVRDEIERDLDLPVNTANDLQDDMIGPKIIKENREQVTKRMKDDKYKHIVAIYLNSMFQDFQIFLRTDVDLVEDDIRLVLDEYKSNYFIYKLQPGINNFERISEAFLKILQPEYDGYHNTIDIEFDDITMKTKLVAIPGIIDKRYDENSFFNTILGFNPFWDFKHYNEYFCQKKNICSTNKIHLKCDVIDGSVANGLRQPLSYSFVLDKLPGYKNFSEPETIHYEKK